MRSPSPRPRVGWCLVIYCLVSLALSSNQNDTLDGPLLENEIPTPNGPEIYPEMDELETNEHPSPTLDQDSTVESLPGPEPADHEGISQTTEPSTILDESNLTLAESTAIDSNVVDADLLIPSIEILTTPENPAEVPGFLEIPAISEVIALDVQASEPDEEEDLDNLLNVSNNATRNNESGSSEDDIPSFSEWTLKVLAEEEKSGANGSTGAQVPAKVSAAPKLRQKNYASPDCGAKILAANSEAEHTSAVLDPSRDEYFLSICSAKIWFVIELCEAIQAQRVEIANFELFSSSPKDFRVYISDRYPRRDWAPIGLFTAADERSIQSFPLEGQLFGKFVKVELVSHYGKEHFCPISLFRVYGNSEYEVLDIEEDSRSGSVSNRHEEDSTEEEMLFDFKENNSSHTEVAAVEGRNLFGSAKDAVINIVKKAAEVLGKSPSPEKVTTNETNKNENDTTTTTYMKICHTAVDLVNVSRAINGSLSCEWKELNFLASLPWLQSSLLQQCQAEPSDQHYFSMELAFARSVWKPSTIQALCHWILPEESVPPFEPMAPVLGDTVTSDISCSTVETLAAVVGSEGENGIVESPAASIELAELENLEHLFSEEMESVGTSPEDVPGEAKIVDSLAIEPSKPINIPQQQPPQQPPQQPQQRHQQQQQTQTQKESVFVRLSNRIRVLERNMSLSGQYLEELSRRYKRQVDDMQKSLNRTLQTLNDTLQRMSMQDERYQAMFSHLQGEIAELKSSAHQLAEENNVLRAQTMEQHLFLMMVEVIVVAVLVVFLLRNLTRPPPYLPPDANVVITSQRQKLLHQPATLDFRLEVGQKVEEVKIGKPTGQLSLNVMNMDVQSHKKKQQTSPTPSLADSSSSGCESAFSFPNSNHAASRDPSPVDRNKARARLAKTNGKKQQKKKKNNTNHLACDKSSVYHAKDVKSSPTPPPKIRLKSDNWEWHSRAKILAAQFIQENYQGTGMRSSF